MSKEGCITKKDYIRKIDEELFKIEKDISYLEKKIEDIDNHLGINGLSMEITLDDKEVEELKNIIIFKLEKKVEELKEKHNKLESGVSLDDYVMENIHGWFKYIDKIAYKYIIEGHLLVLIRE